MAGVGCVAICGGGGGRVLGGFIGKAGTRGRKRRCGDVLKVMVE